MNQRFLSLCGMIAPLLFTFTAILGGAIRPDYSHISNTISELFSPGSPNKLLLDALHTLYAILLILFGIGLLQFVRKRERSGMVGVIGASLFIAMGVLSLTSATIFPQDAWGSPPTFPGKMHITVLGIIGLISILYILFLGIWFHRTKIFPKFRTYSFITIGAVMVSTGFFLATWGSPIMGINERISGLIGFQWTFYLALWMFSRSEKESRELSRGDK
jgi:hypothetical membrane protein